MGESHEFVRSRLFIFLFFCKNLLTPQLWLKTCWLIWKKSYNLICASSVQGHPRLSSLQLHRGFCLARLHLCWWAPRFCPTEPSGLCLGSPPHWLRCGVLLFQLLLFLVHPTSSSSSSIASPRMCIVGWSGRLFFQDYVLFSCVFVPVSWFHVLWCAYAPMTFKNWLLISINFNNLILMYSYNLLSPQ